MISLSGSSHAGFRPEFPAPISDDRSPVIKIFNLWNKIIKLQGFKGNLKGMLQPLKKINGQKKIQIKTLEF